MYCKVKLTSPVTVVGIEPLPASIAGWAYQDGGAAALADPAGVLDPCPDDLAGYGWWPVVDDPVPDHDDLLHHVVPADLTADIEARVVRRAWRIDARPDAAARLSARRTAAIAEVKSAAGLAIAAWVPPGWDLAYAEKHRQALIALGGGEAGQALIREAAAREYSVAALAGLILAKAAAWDAALGAIEELRLSADAAIAAATSGTEIDHIIKGILWPSP